ncbi:hypothetical protein [Nonomuraea indica]|uniref:hypothetical protein n=1 Tax=Nonomuraea indica TaxID=1581193 RepID=UPI000C7C9332|nr:hypothetical protein [Nonomuraea indica]
MATVRQLLAPEEAAFAASGFPQFVKANGTAFPVTGLAFDAAATESAYFKRKLLSYGSGSLTLSVAWYADTASSGVVRWSAAVACITPNTDSQDVETKAFAAATDTDDTHLATTGQRLHTHDIVVANVDSAAADDYAWIRLQRLAAHANDTLAGDAIVVGVELSYSDT